MCIRDRVKTPGLAPVLEGVTVTLGLELIAVYGGTPSNTRNCPEPVPQTPASAPVNENWFGMAVSVVLTAPVIPKTWSVYTPVATSTTCRTASCPVTPAFTRRTAIAAPVWSVVVVYVLSLIHI